MAQMNVLTELWLGYGVGEYSATRGFDAAALQAAVGRLEERGWVSNGRTLTPLGRAAREEIEAATDEGQTELVRALGSGLDEMVLSLRELGGHVLAAHAAPADPRKRAAG